VRHVQGTQSRFRRLIRRLRPGCHTQAFDVGSGELVGCLKEGHYDAVNCCCWNSRMRELYSGGNDWQVLVWDVPDAAFAVGGQQEGDQDNWSD
jgi:hypothetical protein